MKRKREKVADRGGKQCPPSSPFVVEDGGGDEADDDGHRTRKDWWWDPRERVRWKEASVGWERGQER